MLNKKILFLFCFLFSLKSVAETKYFLGFDYGLGTSRGKTTAEEFKSSELLGVKLLGSYDTKNFVFDLGGGAFNYKQKNDLFTGSFKRVELESEVGYLHFSPKVKVFKNIHLGLFYDHYLGDGILVSDQNNFIKGAVGSSLTYEKRDSKIPFRVGVSYEMGTNFGKDDIDHSVAKAFIQIGFPFSKQKEVKRVSNVNFIASQFNFDSYKLPVYNLMKITQLARMLKGNDDWELVIVEGHTDSIGSERYNINLSKLRVDSAFQIFKQEGLPESKIRLIYRGERDPLVSEKNFKDRRKNRRIEIEIRSKDKKLLEDIRVLFEVIQ